jgi:hypothetical protein
MPIALRRALLVCLCALLSFGAPLSFGAAMADMPCKSMTASDQAQAHDCDCDASDKAVCMTLCAGVSSAQSLPVSLSAALPRQHPEPFAGPSNALQSFTGPPARHPPR